MSTRWNRRNFLWQSSLSALSVLILDRSQHVVAAGRPASVLVLGAGLSGLQTALLLEAHGLSVTVLEARDRVGGRVHTLDDLPGKPEGGGQGFSEKYQRLLALTRRLQVPVKPANRLDKALLLHVRGQTVLPQDWAQSPANHLVERERQLLPPQLLTHYLRAHNPFKDALAWTTPRYAALDISLADYLRAQGASAEALRLIRFDPGSLVNHLETTSTLWSLRNNQRSRSRSQPMQIQAGNSRLPEAIAAALESPVQLNKVVVSMHSRETEVEVCCADGTAFRANYAVVTLPFSVLRQVEIMPPLQGAQAEAVQTLPYTAVTQVHLSVRQPWEQDGYSPTMWTDSVLSSLRPHRDEQGRVQSLVCWANGSNAQRLDAMSSPAQAQFVQSELEKIRPGLASQVELSRIVSWGRDPYARGAYSHFAPGQIRRFQNQMAKPWKRIHFAGEHTAVSSPGMESALESAERVAGEILARVRTRS
ncbi:Tryptophan 2-monooxygenase [uncultured Synechococcales cyanobacterium]|uniref:Tryptophan 2-monooxygenase n=1 Tax=uncultured Synechococcales cyanobacterium TaxID=1936017 RepID=A0A6J4VD25_9CYAN|nr:Tryptophan 2-monooxygenase [uncultured Synechococcales cyanobacterium]